MAVKRVITFEDPDGNEVTEEWWFQLNEADCVDLDVAHVENPELYLKEILKNKDSRRLLEVWRQMLYLSAGQRRGKQIAKSPEILDEFKYGGAYTKLFSEIISSDDAGADFFTSIMPKSIQGQVAKHQAAQTANEHDLADVEKVSDEEFYKAAGTNDIMEMDKKYLAIAMQRRENKKALGLLAKKAV